MNGQAELDDVTCDSGTHEKDNGGEKADRQIATDDVPPSEPLVHSDVSICVVALRRILDSRFGGIGGRRNDSVGRGGGSGGYGSGGYGNGGYGSGGCILDCMGRGRSVDGRRGTRRRKEVSCEPQGHAEWPKRWSKLHLRRDNVYECDSTGWRGSGACDGRRCGRRSQTAHVFIRLRPHVRGAIALDRAGGVSHVVVHEAVGEALDAVNVPREPFAKGGERCAWGDVKHTSIGVEKSSSSLSVMRPAVRHAEVHARMRAYVIGVDGYAQWYGRGRASGREGRPSLRIDGILLVIASLINGNTTL